MKVIKKILMVCSLCSLLTVTNCFATTIEKTDITEDKLNCYKTYIVQDTEKDIFIENIEKNIEVSGDKYIFNSYIAEGGPKTETLNISTTKNIISKTKDLESIIEQLGNSIEYKENGYIGEYQLDTQNIQIKTIYNGFREDLIEETINYTNLERNDLDFIPKQTVKEGLTLDLIKVEWEIETTKIIGEYEVPNLYTAKCYYAGKQRINYPNTYSVTAEYKGTAIKEIKNPYTYTIKYNKEEVLETKENNLIIPIVGSTTGIILVILFLFTKNVTVYNYKDGKYVKIGKTRMTRNNTIKLNKYSLFETTNKYKLEFSKQLTQKMQGKIITISKGNVKIKMLVSTNNDKYSIETRI